MKPLDIQSYQSLRDYVGFDETSTAALRELYPHARPHFANIIDDFYEAIRSHPEASSVVTGGDEQIARLKRSLVGWLESVLLGPHDAAYLEAHARIGRVHVRIALPQAFMFTAMNRIRTRLTQIVVSMAAGNADVARRGARAVNQVLDLELAIMLDTYRENYIEQVRAAERLATIGQLAGSVGHELRNPLGVIESSLFIVRQRMERAGIKDEKLERHCDRMESQVRVCVQTIENLLDLARERPPKRRRQALLPVLESASERANVKARLELEFALPEGLTVDADTEDLTLVLANLLLNAAEAEGTSKVRITASKSRGGTEILLSDDGPGVPLELRHRIFDALFTTKVRGTGLGLALCQRIMYAHAGEIGLEAPEQGACFRLWFPDVAPQAG